MRCTIDGCPGTYEAQETTLVERVHGQLVVVEHVPVECCDVGGDMLLHPDTVRHLEALRQTTHPPIGMVPLYAYVA